MEAIIELLQINGGIPRGGGSLFKGPRTVCCPSWPAALLAPEESVIHNCPDLSDVTATLDILRLLAAG